MTPPDYAERVYAGILGKIIGVYLGRPFEQWSRADIESRLGEIRGYVHEKLGVPLVVTDDDISGTFTFFRALEDAGFNPDFTSQDVADAWLNYIIENRTILWWGGVGNSTEHTAFLRLRAGVPAPESGSIAQNGPIIAQQIGAQIFIDAWGLVNPNDPERAAEYARRAARVSHDGEAVHGAAAVAAMVAAAFGESRVDALLDTAMSVVPADSMIAQVHRDVREWVAVEPDWRAAWERLNAVYGYDKWLGGCHMVPNHAVIVLALAAGGGDFGESMAVVNTAGFDTDCNSGNVGCILGVAGGLAGLESGGDWRGPVADRILVPTADGSRAISDAVLETRRIVRANARLNGAPEPPSGPRYRFEFPGTRQGFALRSVSGEVAIIDLGPGLTLRWPGGRGDVEAQLGVATFLDEAESDMSGYALLAWPTVHNGQTLVAELVATGEEAVEVQWEADAADANGQVTSLAGPPAVIPSGESEILEWPLRDGEYSVIQRIGLQIKAEGDRPGGLLVRSIDVTGSPQVRFPERGAGRNWARQWINACDSQGEFPMTVQANDGLGLVSTGGEWTDLEVRAEVFSNLADSVGLAVRFGGLRQFVALAVGPNTGARLVHERNGEQVLTEGTGKLELGTWASLTLSIRGDRIEGSFNDERLQAEVPAGVRPVGGIALLAAHGRARFREVNVVS